MVTITKQQIRVFTKFAVAFLMTGYAYAFSAQGETSLALATMLSALTFIGSIMVEARQS